MAFDFVTYRTGMIEAITMYDREAGHGISFTIPTKIAIRYTIERIHQELKQIGRTGNQF